MDHMSAGPRTHRQENGSDVRVGIGGTGNGPKRPYGGTNLEPPLAGQCGMPAAPSRWVSYPWSDPVSADSACLRIRSWAAGKDVVERRLATGQGPRRAMFAAGVSAGDGPGRPGLVPQG